MLLTQLVIQNVGPFAEAQSIRFEKDVTVLTGANDTGKSSILRAIELLCGITGGGRVLQESEVNMDRIGQANTVWRNDPEILCEATFETAENGHFHFRKKVAAGAEVKVRCMLAPEIRQIAELNFRESFGRGEWSKPLNLSITKFPNVICLPLAEPLRQVIDLTQPNPTELKFLQAAFGPNFSHEKYASLSVPNYYNAISKAKAEINLKLRQFLPLSLKLEFDFVPISDKREKISIQMRDGHEGHAPLGVRGTGIGRIVTIMAALLTFELDGRNHIILIDEPETSLHADAQHTLRSFLENLASKPNVQVVYATHSPSMINSVRTDSIRLISRCNNGQVAHSAVNNRPIDENFLSIRSSLGMTPSDSLLFAPVTIIVEGPSEVLGIPIILRRLWKESRAGFEDVGQLLSHVHFLDGQGDTFDQLCKLAVSQGAKPIIFLDGDKRNRLEKIKQNFPHVPVILLEGKTEFEEIIPKDFYIESVQWALNQRFHEPFEQLTPESYKEWETNKNPYPNKAFSKRVDDWVSETTQQKLVKPLVMKHALSVVPLDQVNVTPLRELVAQIRLLLN